jgi:hypothetical protein
MTITTLLAACLLLEGNPSNVQIHDQKIDHSSLTVLSGDNVFLSVRFTFM